MKKIVKIIGILIATLILASSTICFFMLKDKKIDAPTNIKDTIDIREFNNTEYYILKGDYKGEYDIQKNMLNTTLSEINEYPDINKIMSYDNMSEYCKKWNLHQKYDNKTQNYIVFSYTVPGAVSVNARLVALEDNENSVNLYIWDNSYGVTADVSFYTIIIPTEKTTEVDVLFTPVFTKEEYEIIKKRYVFDREPEITCDKPILYLYPEEETNVEVTLGKPELITHSYPKYNNKWNVVASPDGTLKNIDNDRKLYSLYYESEAYLNFHVEDEGFVIKGSDSVSFLEDKLEILGLNEKEAEEFIIYWLPILESNEYNYIRFATTDEINANMPLSINPAPDTTIRVLMIFKGLDEPIDVKEQTLEYIERNGFIAVEWGGVQLK